MNRREALKRSMWISGGILSTSTIAAIMSGCQPEGTAAPWTPQALSQAQADLLSELCDCLLPATDTPGALDLGVPKFIDDMVANVMREKNRQSFIEGLDALAAEVQERHGKNFSELSAAQKNDLLIGHDKAAYEFNQRQKVQETDPDAADKRPFFGKLKALTYTGFFLTEAGGSEFLRYEYIPGKYQGCIPLEEVGGAWLDA